MCQETTSRQFARSTVPPCFAADSSAKLHCSGSACMPAVVVEPIDSTPVLCLPASVMPDGLIRDATANSISSWSGSSCSLASRSVNQSLSWSKRSPPANRRLMTPIASSCRSRSSIGSTPNVWASDGSAPGPEPKMTRPRLWWSSCTMRCATMKGWW